MARNVQTNMGFSETTKKNLKFYVYRLIDPRSGNTFYVGKGKNNRIFDHVNLTKSFIGNLSEEDDGNDKETENSAKIQTIRDIKSCDLDVMHIIHRHGMDEATALEVEAALIDAYNPYGNIQNGISKDRGCQSAQQIENLYKSEEAKIQDDLVLFIKVNRSYNGDRDLYEAVRKAWLLNEKRVKRAKYVLACKDGIIVGIFGNLKWTKNQEQPLKLEFSGERINDEKICKRYLKCRIPQKLTVTKGGQNPCRYSYDSKGNSLLLT